MMKIKKSTLKKLIIICSIIVVLLVAAGVSSAITHRTYINTIKHAIDDFVDFGVLFTYEDETEDAIKKLEAVTEEDPSEIFRSETQTVPVTEVYIEAPVTSPAEPPTGVQVQETVPQTESYVPVTQETQPAAVETIPVTESATEIIPESSSFITSVYGYEIVVPVWDGQTISIEVNGNVPFFTANERNFYSLNTMDFTPLDYLGRSGAAKAVLAQYNLPEEERDDGEELAQLHPVGLYQTKYSEDLIDNGFLYNRCHLIGFLLGGPTTAENVVAGTRALNVDGMLPYEQEVAYYLKGNAGKHVLYRVTPLYNGEELSCRGVLMEAYSLEDGGNSIKYNIFVYNEQPGIIINHADGSSRLK